LGPVESVTAEAGAGDVTHLVLHHRGGASRRAAVGLGGPAPQGVLALCLCGPPRRAAMPRARREPVSPPAAALAAVVTSARSGQLTHPRDVRFGREVVLILAQAAGQLADMQ